MSGTGGERRVLQVLGRSAGGIARHVAQVVAALDGEEVVVDIAGPRDLPIPMPKKVIPVTVPEGMWAGHLPAVRRLRSIITGGRYDIVHAHGLRATIDAALAARPIGTPVLSTVHNLVQPDVSGPVRSVMYRFAEPLAVQMSARTFAVSQDIAARLRSTAGGASKIEVLYLGIGKRPRIKRRSDHIRRELDVVGGQKLVVTASRLQRQKALEVMLQAVARLPPNIILAILGQGPLEAELKALANRLLVSSRVRFLGFRENIADYIAAADAFCLSSNWEGIPLAAQEAILLSTPVVATDVGGMRELIEDRRSGLLVGKGDAPALARALQEVIYSDDLRRRITDQARRDLNERFSTERMLARLHAAYIGSSVAA